MYTYRGEGVTVVTSSAVYSFKMFGYHFFAFVFCVFFLVNFAFVFIAYNHG